MRIHANIVGLNAGRNLAMHNSRIAKAMERLSTGCRINRAGDDPAGLAVSEKLKYNLTRLSTDKRNAVDYQSMLSVADGSLGEVHTMLNRMTELANLASNETLSETDRKVMNSEYQQLMDEIDRIGSSSAFNGHKLFGEKKSGSATGNPASTSPVLGEQLIFQGGNLNAYLDGLDKLLVDISNAAKQGDDEKLLSLGIDKTNGKSDADNLKLAVLNFTKNNADRLLNTPSETGDTNSIKYQLALSDGDLSVEIGRVSGSSLGLSDTNLLSAEDAKKAADAAKKAIDTVSAQRGNMGAMYNRLEHTINNISTMEQNLTDALSRILDTDMAKEMMILTKEKLLAQASIFVMAQANQEPEQVLSLIKSM